MAKNDIEITKEGYLKLIKQIYGNKLEEREIALDRYLKADELMDSPEAFSLIGKQAVAFLNLAAESTNNLAALAKEIKSIVYKDADTQNVNVELSDDFKLKISEHIEEIEKQHKDKK